ncbi:hypothetical protein GF382_03265 [Candidatus Falkowbacteria bacterium]|nr:hypothetical protein [Candidatus Falkowbacteria bacterium]
MKTSKKLIFLVLIIFSLLFNFLILAQNSQAGNFMDLGNQEGFKSGEISQEFGQSSSDPKDVREIAANIIQIFLSLLAIIFLALIIFAGYKYMTAQGNEEQISSAKKQLIQSVIGLLIILAAYGITYYVLKSLESATSSDFFMPR